jgi:predicted DNA-binding ribbon-helix-helix protein
LREIAVARDMTPSDLVATISSDRQHGNLSSAIRQFVLGFYRAQYPITRGDARAREVGCLLAHRRNPGPSCVSATPQLERE